MDDGLWAYEMTFKTHIDLSQYMLVFEKACHLPKELDQ